MPNRIRFPRDLVHAPAAERRRIFFFGARWSNRGAGFDAIPDVLFAIATSVFDQYPFAVELFSAEKNVQLSLPIIAIEQLVRANVPDHHRAAAVFSARDDPFKFGVVHWMIFNRDGEPPIAQLVGRPLRHRPRFERPAHFEAEIIVQAAGGMLLNHKKLAASLSA